MIVLDASAALDLLLGSGRAAEVDRRVRRERIQVPHLIDLEIAHVLRRHVLGGAVGVARAETALSTWMEWDLDRYPHDLLLSRVWQLRPIVSAYDAAYVALAEALQIPLLTCDAKLARSHGHRANIELA